MIRKVYGNDSMSDTQIKEWFKWLKDNRASVDSDPRFSRPSMSKTAENVEYMRSAINNYTFTFLSFKVLQYIHVLFNFLFKGFVIKILKVFKESIIKQL